MATRTISTTIKLDGEAEFKKQMSSVNSELKTLSSELKLSESEFKGQANTVEALTAKDKVLTQQIEQQKEKVKALEQAVKDASEAYGDTDKRTDSYRQQLNNTKAALNDMNDDLKQNRKYMDESKNSSDGCAHSIDEYGKEVKQAGDETISFGDVLKANVIGGAIVSGVRALGDAIKGIANGMGEAVVAGAAYADNIMTLSTQTGINTDQLQKYQYMQELTDVSLDTMTGSMAKLIKNMATAQKGTGDAASAFSSLGIEISNSDGTLRNNQDVFADTIEALGKMDNETQRDAYSMQIFGKSAQDLNPLIAVGADGIAKYSEEAEKMGYVLSEDALSSLGSVDDAIQRLTNAATAAKNGLVSEIAPGVTEVIEGVTAVLTGNIDEGEAKIDSGLEKFAGYIDEFGPKAQEALTNFTSVVAKHLPEVVAFGIDIAGSLAVGIIKGIPDIVDKVPEIMDALSDALDNLTKALWDAGAQMAAKIWNGIKDGFKAAITGSGVDATANALSYKIYGSGTSATRTVNGSHALGLDYVPFDGYIAELHKGERILTAQEASIINGLSSADLRPKTRGLSASEMQSIAAQSVNALMTGGGGGQNISITVPLTIDGKEFARATISDYRLVSKSTPEVALA